MVSKTSKKIRVYEKNLKFSEVRGGVQLDAVALFKLIFDSISGDKNSIFNLTKLLLPLFKDIPIA